VNATARTCLYAVRHGETEWNRAGKAQGHFDSPLTESGVLQAKALATALVGRGIEVIYSSDLGRAMQTASAIGQALGLEVHTDTRLRERHLGVMQGRTPDEIRQEFPEVWEGCTSGDPDFCFPGGESARQRYERNVAFAEAIAARHAGKTILVVAHGGVLNSFFTRALCIPLPEPRRFSLFNAAINQFSVRADDWRLESWGDTHHLSDTPPLDDA